MRSTMITGCRPSKGGMFTLLIVFAAILLPAGRSYSQKYDGGRIKLQSGEVVKGRIMEFDTEDGLHLQMQDGRTMWLDQGDIKKITFRKLPAQASTFQKTAYNPLSVGRFYHQLQTGLLLGNKDADLALHAVNGYMFNQYLGTGAGIGLDRYSEYTVMPLYVQVKGFLRDHRVAPFYYANAGYGFAWHDSPEGADVQGGLYWEAGMGYQVQFRPFSLTCTLGYRNASARRDFDSPEYDVWSSRYYPSGMDISEKTFFRRFYIGVGLLF